MNGHVCSSVQNVKLLCVCLKRMKLIMKLFCFPVFLLACEAVRIRYIQNLIDYTDGLENEPEAIVPPICTNLGKRKRGSQFQEERSDLQVNADDKKRQHSHYSSKRTLEVKLKAVEA